MRLTVVLGTRPEAIKLAPVILEARRRGHQVKVVFTGQHRHIALPLLKFFGIRPDLDLAVMRPDQSLAGLSSRVLAQLDKHREKIRADWLIVQGDTTSAFTAAYWAFCERITVAHVEAGLRTHNLDSPFPEEGSRQLISRITNLHLAPTSMAQRNLRQEGIPQKAIAVVGNTAIDTLQLTLKELGKMNLRRAHGIIDPELLRWIGARRLVLVTAHRRESFGQEFARICEGIKRLIDSDPNLCAVYPVHPNPNVRKVVYAKLAKHSRIRLVEPLSYLAFTTLMQRSALLLTDSGGVQEEGPTLRKPILVMRNNTERPEGVRKGFANLVGTNPAKIYREGVRALKDGCRGRGPNPYGDGQTARRIVAALEKAKRK